MRIAALIIGIIGSLAGIGGALFALMVGGLSGVFGAEGAEMVVGLGWAAIVISLIALVAAALAIAKPLEAGIAMIIAGIAGIISISVAYVIGGPLLIIAGILAIIGKKELTDTLPSILTDKAYRNCPYCAEKIRANSVECEYCNSELSPVNDAEAEQEKSMVCAEWIIATILLPLIGLVGGMYGLIKGRRGAGGLFGISILACIVAIIALSVIYSTPDAPHSGKEDLSSKTDEPAYIAEPELEEAPVIGSISAGTYLVNVDIEPGRYRSDGGISYWERLSGLSGELGDILANEALMPGIVYVDIKHSDEAFTFRGGGNFYMVDDSFEGELKKSFGDGIYWVGKDIAPGRYRSTDGSAYWARLKGFSGDFGEIIANDLTQGSAVIEILDSDVGFETRGVQWEKLD